MFTNALEISKSDGASVIFKINVPVPSSTHPLNKDDNATIQMVAIMDIFYMFSSHFFLLICYSTQHKNIYVFLKKELISVLFYWFTA
jgi:hypothetical protein